MENEYRWSLYQMEILNHHHCSAAPFPRASAPAYPETVAGLVELGLLDRVDFPKTTALGEALIEAWKQTPLPVQRFIDPRSGEVLEPRP